MEFKVTLNTTQAVSQLNELAKKAQDPLTIKINVQLPNLSSLQSDLNKAFSGAGGSSGGLKPIQQNTVQLTRDMEKLTSAIADMWKKQGSMSNNAGLAAMIKDLAELNGQYAKNTNNIQEAAAALQRKVELLKQAADLEKKSGGSGSSNSYRTFTQPSGGGEEGSSGGGGGSSGSGKKAPSFRRAFEMGMGQSGGLINALPGGSALGNIFRSTQSGFAQGRSAAAVAGTNPMMGGLAGGALSAAGSALVMTVQMVVQALATLGQRARDTANFMGGGGGKYEGMRQAAVGKNLQEGKAADNPIVRKGVELWDNLSGAFMGGVGKILGQVNDVSNAIGDFGAELKKGLGLGGGGAKEKQDERKRQEFQATKLVGDAKVGFDELKRSRSEMERDIGVERYEMEKNLSRQKRDLGKQEFEQERGFYRQKQDMEKSMRREDEDYQYNKQKILEDFEGKMAEKQYNIARSNARRDFLKQQQDSVEDFLQGKADRREDFQRNKGYAIFDFNKSRSDARQDFARSKGDAAQDFGINKSRSEEDFRDNLADMMMSGASGLSYLQSARNFRKQQKRNEEDFARSNARQDRDFGIGEERANRDFAIGQQRNQTEFDIGEKRNDRDFNKQQSRAQRDFLISEQDAQLQRSLELESHYYQQRMALTELEKSHARAVEDMTTQATRFAEDVATAREKMATQKADMQEDEALTRYKQDVSETTRRRSQSEAEGNFAKNLIGPDGKYLHEFAQMSRDNPELQKWANYQEGREGKSITGSEGMYTDWEKLYESQGMLKKNLADTGFDYGGSYAGGDWGNGGGGTIGYTTASGVTREVWQGLNDRQRIDLIKSRGLNPADYGMPSKATGGFIDKDMIAQVHGGEFIVNPRHPNKQKQAEYALQALKEMGYQGAFYDGGYVGGIGGAAANRGAGYGGQQGYAFSTAAGMGGGIGRGVGTGSIYNYGGSSYSSGGGSGRGLGTGSVAYQNPRDDDKKFQMPTTSTTPVASPITVLEGLKPPSLQTPSLTGTTQNGFSVNTPINISMGGINLNGSSGGGSGGADGLLKQIHLASQNKSQELAQDIGKLVENQKKQVDLTGMRNMFQLARENR